jgi:hypothetical protein
MVITTLSDLQSLPHSSLTQPAYHLDTHTNPPPQLLADPRIIEHPYCIQSSADPCAVSVTYLIIFKMLNIRSILFFIPATYCSHSPVKYCAARSRSHGSAVEFWSITGSYFCLLVVYCRCVHENDFVKTYFQYFSSNHLRMAINIVSDKAQSFFSGIIFSSFRLYGKLISIMHLLLAWA